MLANLRESFNRTIIELKFVYNLRITQKANRIRGAVLCRVFYGGYAQCFYMRVYKIVRKQGNARQCAVCGIDNEFGFDARFYETDTDEVICIFKTKEKQQSFPDRVHGGVISAVVDEAIRRAGRNT